MTFYFFLAYECVTHMTHRSDTRTSKIQCFVKFVQNQCFVKFVHPLPQKTKVAYQELSDVYHSMVNLLYYQSRNGCSNNLIATSQPKMMLKRVVLHLSDILTGMYFTSCTFAKFNPYHALSKNRRQDYGARIGFFLLKICKSLSTVQLQPCSTGYKIEMIPKCL